jgi:hypothetical protein
MGLDLSVAPIKYASDDFKWWLSYTRLAFDRNYDLFGQITDCGRDTLPPILTPQPLPDNIKFDWYDDSGLKTITEDAYGSPLTFVRAGEFTKLQLPKQSGEWNRAMIMFLCQIPPKTPVVLWWH